MRFFKWIAIAGMALSLPLSVLAVDLGADGLTTAGDNAGIDTSGTEGSLGGIVGLIINTALNLIGVLLFVYFIYSGFLWMTAAGDEKRVKKAKDIMRNSLIGLLIIFMALGVVTFIAGYFSAGGNLGTSTSTYDSAVTGAGFTAANADLLKNIGSLINIALNLLGVVLLGIFLYAGWLWMTAAGDQKATAKAKLMMQQAVIGLVIVLASRILAGFVINRLTGDQGALSSMRQTPIHNTWV